MQQGTQGEGRGAPEEPADEVSAGGETWSKEPAKDKTKAVRSTFKRLGNTLDPKVPNLCVNQALGFPAQASQHSGASFPMSLLMWMNATLNMRNANLYSVLKELL